MWEGLLMLLLQPQNFLRVRSVFLVSLVLHVFVCFSLLFVYKDYHQRLVVDLSSRIPYNAIVKLLPLSASRSSSQVLGVKGSKKKGTFSSVKTMAGKQKSEKNKAQQVKKKSPTFLAKQTVASKLVKSGKGKAEVAKKAKTLLQEKKQKLAQQKELKKKEAEKLKHAEKLAQEKKVQEEPKVQKSESSEPLKQEIVENVQTPITNQVITEEMSRGAVGSGGQDILYLTRQELDALQIQQKLQECLFDLWTPPAGIPAEALCEVLVTVGWDGAILETQFLKKTDILIYDLSVQETVEQVVFPHEVWGKQITIAFKP